jgi:hypothetical protein
MKKIILLALTFVLALSLAACDGGESNSTPPSSPNAETTTPETSQPESTSIAGTTSNGNTTPNDSEATGEIAEFLALFGLTEDDIKPEGFVEFQELEMSGTIGQAGVGFIKIVVDKDKTEEAQIKAWFQKVFDKMKSLSLDKKLYTNYQKMDEEATLDKAFAVSTMPGTKWAYSYTLPSGEARLQVSVSYSFDEGIYKMSIAGYPPVK